MKGEKHIGIIMRLIKLGHIVFVLISPNWTEAFLETDKKFI